MQLDDGRLGRDASRVDDRGEAHDLAVEQGADPVAQIRARPAADVAQRASTDS